MSKLVVFDVDGTILDSFGLFEQVLTHYSEKNNLPLPCLTTIKRGYDDPLAHDYKWGVAREEQKFHLYKSFDLMDEWSMSGESHRTPQLFKGVRDNLDHLKDLGHTLAIVTSKSETPLVHLLEHWGVTKHFSAWRTSDDIQRRGEREKPEPDQLLSVIRQLKFSADETVMVGDTTMDIRMGRSSLAHTIGVTWGTHPREFLTDAGAHHIVETKFDDVVATVTKIFD